MFYKSELKSALNDVEVAKEKFIKTGKAIERAAIERFELCKFIEENVFVKVGQFDDMLLSALNIQKKEGEALWNLTALDIEVINTLRNSIGVLRDTVENFKADIKLVTKAYEDAAPTKSVAGGVVAGAGIATMAPTGLLAIATTFGTASTGTAISTLSGAAATNAALAWIGGGALSAGGGGMALGNTFLALAGPIGWGIAGLTIVGGGLFYRSKNKKLTHEAWAKKREILEEENKYSVKRRKILESIKSNKAITEVIFNHIDDITTAFESKGELSAEIKNEITLLTKEIGLINGFMAERISLESNEK